MRDMTRIVDVGDLVFNQKDFRLYTIEAIKQNIFTCKDNVTEQSVDLDVLQGNSLYKVNT